MSQGRGPTSPGTAAVLYRTPRRQWAVIVATLVFVLISLPLAAGLLALGVLASGDLGPAAPALATVIAIPPLVLGAYVIASSRQRFTVTTEGIEVTSFFVTKRYPWASIRLVRVGPASFWAPRATELLLTDGSTVRPLATSLRYAIWRGESPLAHGPDGRTPTRSALAAIDAHQRYLRGEL